MQKIKPCLWFNGLAEEAVGYYVGIFKDSRIVEVSRYGEGAPYPKGHALALTFELQGQRFMALNGAADFKFNESISLFVSCDNQDEVDGYWDKLTANGGKPGQCGWLKDKYGVSWQIVPTALPGLLSGGDAKRSARVMQVMLKMTKLNVAELERAHRGE